MWGCKAAAEISFKRNFVIYGVEKVRRIAMLHGYKVGADGNVLAVENEEAAFYSLLNTVARELGPLAALSCKTALMRISSQETKDVMQQLADESWKINAVAYSLQSSILVFKFPEVIPECRAEENTNGCMKNHSL